MHSLPSECHTPCSRVQSETTSNTICGHTLPYLVNTHCVDWYECVYLYKQYSIYLKPASNTTHGEINKANHKADPTIPTKWRGPFNLQSKVVVAYNPNKRSARAVPVLEIVIPFVKKSNEFSRLSKRTNSFGKYM